ncbi:Ldh family oxidoreductase [Phyllobacterium chamaecytisi]|uniref:Ldh family oxidoreductase n=1 Tax=Phyllobacterium chamaecytisi TaxID=2876082 RepID=UPI00351CF438
MSNSQEEQQGSGKVCSLPSVRNEIAHNLAGENVTQGYSSSGRFSWPKPAARRGYLTLMMVTDPGVASVAPFGGCDPMLASNPVAAGIPTLGNPILIDQHTSLVSNAQVRSADKSKPRPGNWIVAKKGWPTNDPAALPEGPPGTIMPLGGEDFGYKGFGFGIMVEAFALALSGHGRFTPKQRGAQGVFLQFIDPSSFSGRGAFLQETTDFVRWCKESRVAEGSRRSAAR